MTEICDEHSDEIPVQYTPKIIDSLPKLNKFKIQEGTRDDTPPLVHKKYVDELIAYWKDERCTPFKPDGTLICKWK